MPRKSRAKDIPSDINPHRRPSTPRTPQAQIHERTRGEFTKSKKVKAPSAQEAKEFDIRTRIARYAEKMPNITGKLSTMSVMLIDGGKPDEEGIVRAKINIGRGYMYVTIPARLLEATK